MAHFSQQLEKWAKEPFETEGFKTSFPVCKRYILTPADTGNWRISTIAAATWAVEETFSSTVGKGLPSGRRIIPFTGAGAAAGLLLRQFPVPTELRPQLLHTGKEVQKPWFLLALLPTFPAIRKSRPPEARSLCKMLH